jgi:hypothetical protein
MRESGHGSWFFFAPLSLSLSDELRDEGDEAREWSTGGDVGRDCARSFGGGAQGMAQESPTCMYEWPCALFCTLHSLQDFLSFASGTAFVCRVLHAAEMVGL